MLVSAIQSTARLKIHDGKLEAFREVAARCIDCVRTNDKGTLQYDWFLDETGAVCVVRETYRDSDAVFEHMENLGPVLGYLLALCDMELEIFGRPSPALADVMRDFGARMYEPLEAP